jgi:hypothetical protein
MSQQSSSSAFQALFNTALQDYKNKTGVVQLTAPLPSKSRNATRSIITILGAQARIFREFRDHGKRMNSLERLVDVLCSPFFTTALEKGIDLTVRPKKHSWCTLAVSLVVDRDSIATPACESCTCCHPYSICCMSLIL